MYIIFDNPNQSDLGLKTWFRIGWDCCLGLNRIRSDRFFTIFHQTSYKTFFELVRNDSHWLGYRMRQFVKLQ